MCDKHGSKCISFQWWPCWFSLFYFVSEGVLVLQVVGATVFSVSQQRQRHEPRATACQHLHKNKNRRMKKKKLGTNVVKKKCIRGVVVVRLLFGCVSDSCFLSLVVVSLQWQLFSFLFPCGRLLAF